MKSLRLAFWILVAVTLAVYAAMLFWSLPTVSEAAGGLAPFDMRPTGYSFEEAEAFLTAISPEGTTFYLKVQHTLDLAYPALLAATLFFAIAGLAPAGLGAWRWLLALVALPGAVCDYLENAAVSAMLTAGPDGLTPALVETADRWTGLKSAFTALAMLVMVALLIVRVARRMRFRTDGHAP